MIESFEDCLNSGGEGDVWKAKDNLKRDVAVKFISNENKKMLDEIGLNVEKRHELLASIKSENVVAIHFHTQVKHPVHNEERYSIAMELLEGETLLSYLLKNHTIDNDSAKNICTGILNGLSDIHKKSIEHGDLSNPENIMIKANGIPVIIDLSPKIRNATFSSRAQEAVMRKDIFDALYLINEVLAKTNYSAYKIESFLAKIIFIKNVEIIKKNILDVIFEPIDEEQQIEDLFFSILKREELRASEIIDDKFQKVLFDEAVSKLQCSQKTAIYTWSGMISDGYIVEHYFGDTMNLHLTKLGAEKVKLAREISAI